jgi:hypothetical protein
MCFKFMLSLSGCTGVLSSEVAGATLPGSAQRPAGPGVTVLLSSSVTAVRVTGRDSASVHADPGRRARVSASRRKSHCVRQPSESDSESGGGWQPGFEWPRAGPGLLNGPPRRSDTPIGTGGSRAGSRIAIPSPTSHPSLDSS